MNEPSSVWRTSPVEADKPTSRVWIALGSVLALAVAAALCYALITMGGYRAFTPSSASMEKTIYSGDTFICDQHAYRKQPPARGDVIVFHHHGDLILVKRLIGLEGDRIEGKDGVVSVNGKVLNEPYAQHEGQSVDNLDNFGPKTVAPGEVFVLGDNRNRSLDSRLPEFGEVQQTDIMGKALYVVKSNHGQNGQSIR